MFSTEIGNLDEGQLPHPGAWATFTLTSASPAAAWETFAGVLKRLGFENCCYVSEVPRFKLELPDRDQIFGHLVSPEFEQTMRDLPDSGASYSVAPAASRGESLSLDPVVDLNDPQTPATVCATLKVMMDFGFAGGWVMPVSDRRKGTFSVLMIDCSRDRPGQQKLIDQHSPYLKSSVVFFREGLEVRQLLEASSGPLLSPREADCMTWTMAGRSAKEIGALLGIAMSTVNDHVSRAIQKLGATNRSQACARAMLAGCLTQLA